MDLSHLIVGPVLTEKGERMKADRTYAIRVHPDATKVDITLALQRLYGVEVEGVRTLWVHGKWRRGKRGAPLRKRAPWKKALVRLTSKSKALDLAAFLK